MKLLIADDEALTREGLISSIDWNSLGIRQIFQADDGLHALEIARIEKPDIILCDVRMPRMDGIQMVEQLEKFLPDTSVIFMSGYSDKEYLKAAIKLKAINYVEKPLNPEEIKEAVLEAKERREEKERTRQNETLHSLETVSRFALLLTKPYQQNEERINQLAAELNLRLMPGCCFVTYIVKLRNNEPDSATLSELRQDLRDYVEHYHMRSFYVQLHAIYHVFHILSDSAPSSIAFASIEKFLTGHFESLGEFYIGRGDTAAGISRAYHSYTSAAVTLQSSFFFQPGVILRASEESSYFEPSSVSEQQTTIPAEFADALLSKDEEQCRHVLDRIHTLYTDNRYLLPNQAKDTYFHLFYNLNDCRQKLKLSVDSSENTSEESILENLENCFYYQELHQMLLDKTKQFFDSLHSYVPEDSTIFLIKDYINKHYANDTLSIKEISDHVFLSASYVCTYFKAQTGQTLNQYLTEFRMEKAMQLLADARYQITDISSKTGYSNGNYFSKSFKKFTGLTPSKYREKMLG